MTQCTKVSACVADRPNARGFRTWSVTCQPQPQTHAAPASRKNNAHSSTAAFPFCGSLVRFGGRKRQRRLVTQVEGGNREPATRLPKRGSPCLFVALFPPLVGTPRSILSCARAQVIFVRRWPRLG
ncbi:hypothetical protein TRVL_07775 [Trypanosoma vivax]|nr:hypothetical protein TRVL_07775 [Trypanosoma vivax]